MSRQKRASRTGKETRYLVKVGESIRAARKQRGVSQEEFADIAGFSRSYYTAIETGKRNISVLNLIKIIETLNVEPKEILDFIKPK
jgi:transcriptional regulator with XRE-family HTH domain